MAGRFELEARIDEDREDGVYRARDLERGQLVVLRVLWADSHAQEAERFLLGARMLAELRHPGFEIHVAHGRIAHGKGKGEGLLFLATEWIEGERLEDRLRSHPLSIGECLALLRAAAEALAIAHQQGLAHGDLRPSRLLLPSTEERRPERVVLTGFGVVSRNPAWTTATASHRIIEALRYVAPEQARGQVRRSPSADVFSLGCMLLECLTGTAPWQPAHVGDARAVLAQILFQELPPLRQLYPELPETLAQLVGRMLAKHPDERPRDGQAVLEALARIELTPAQLGLMSGAPPAVMAVGERRLLCLVLARPLLNGTAPANSAPLEPPAEPPQPLPLEELAELRASFGVQIDPLLDGSLIALVHQGRQTMMDVAAQAARLALALRSRLPERSSLAQSPDRGRIPWELALVTAYGVASGTQLVDEALARAVALLEVPAERGEDDPCGPWIDELSARLLDLRFQVHAPEGAQSRRALLRGERSGRDELRPLLGTVTPCIGRERELDLLERWLEYSIDEPIAQALLVTAPSGVGKSRLRQEFVRRIEERGTRVALWIGRGDPMRAGTAYGILGHALRELCGIRGTRDERDTPHGAEQRARFSERIGRNLPPMERPQVAEFLGELCGLPFPDSESARLRAARADPRLMSDQVAAAFTTFLAAECAHKPVLLILEDLHWSDAATLRLVEAALHDLPEQPLAVLGLARPELKEMFPRLWGDRNTQELRLQGLTRKASAELVRRVLSERTQIGTETVERIITQAAGNTLFLEELIRAVAEGRGGELPETVLAMLQARFERLVPMARRLVRMASLFGDSFWGKGVYALLGGDRNEQEIERALESLVDGEVLVVRGENRATGERQFAFRHSLLRDAAYGVMSEEDRRLGHRLVAAYLERSGEDAPLVLAEHYRRGGRPERAAVHYSRAAQLALATSDLKGVLAHVAQGVACGARGELLGTLRSSESWAHAHMGDFPAADQAIQQASELLLVGSPGWVSLQGVAMELAGFQNQRQRLLAHMELLATTPLGPGAEKSFLDPGLMGSGFASMMGLRTPATLFRERLREIVTRLGPHEPRARGLFELCVVWYELCLEGHTWGYWAAAAAAVECFAASGDRFNRESARCHSGVGLILIGEIDRGLGLCREMIDQFERSGELLTRVATQGLCGFALAEMSGRTDHRTLAHAMAEAAVSNPGPQGIWAGLAHAGLAIVRTDEGQLDMAEVAARQTLRALEDAPAGRPLACALLGRILLAQGRLADADAVVQEGLAQLVAQGGAGLFDSKLHLTAAEVWEALGQDAMAQSAFAEARRTLARHAATIPDATARQRFLAHSREHARLTALGLWETEPV